MNDEDDIRSAATLAEHILDQLADALIYCDREGIIRRWNAGAERIFGHGAGEVLGRSLDLIIPENLRAAHWRGFNAAMDSRRTRLDGRPTLTRALHRSGRKLYAEMSFALVADGETVLGSVAIARDVTERTERARAAARAEPVRTPDASGN